MNKVWKASKPAKGKIKQKEELAKHVKMKYRSNGLISKRLKMKHIVILTFLDLWDLFCRFYKKGLEKDQERPIWVILSEGSDLALKEEIDRPNWVNLFKALTRRQEHRPPKLG